MSEQAAPAEAPTPTISVEDAMRVLREHNEARARACMEEVNAALEKHGFALHTTPVQITLVPR